MRIDPLYSFRARFNSSLASTSKWLVGSSSTKTLFSRFIKRQKRTLACSPPDSTWIWLSICLVVKPQRARAARTSAWLRAGKAFQTASSGVWRLPLRPLAQSSQVRGNLPLYFSSNRWDDSKQALQEGGFSNSVSSDDGYLLIALKR